MKRRNLLIGGGGAAAVGLSAFAAARGPSYEAAADAVRKAPPPRGLGTFGHLVQQATLAANSHNTQPWLFSGDENEVSIRPDLSRTTPVVDPDNHHLFASLGCAAENLRLAASAMGRPAEIAPPDAEGRIRILLSGTGAGHDPLADAIPHRQCTRAPYDGRQVPAADLQALAEAAAVDGCSVVLVTDKPRIEQILDLILAANSAQIADPAFVAELRQWLRFSPSEAIRHGDGLYSACSGNPTLPTWIGNLVFPLVFSAESENTKCAAQVRSSAGFALFVSDRDDPAHWVQAGRSYQRFALAATAHGIRHAFLNQPLEVQRYRPELAKLLGLGARRPDLMVRFGYAPPMPRSLRRPVGDVVVPA